MEKIYEYLIENVFEPEVKDIGNGSLNDLTKIIPNDILKPVIEHENVDSDMPFKLDIFDGNNHYIIERIK